MSDSRMLRKGWVKYKRQPCSKRFITRLLWLLYKVPHFFEKVSIQEFNDKRYFRRLRPIGEQIVRNSNSHDEIITLLKESQSQIQDRKSSLDDKVKNLLTLTGVSIPFVTVFLGEWPASLLGIFGMLLLFITILLLLRYWGILTTITVSVSDKWYSMEPTEIRRDLIDDLRYTNHFNDCTVDYLADLFRAARFYFVVALIFLMSNAVLNHFISKVSPVDKIVQAISLSRTSAPATECVDVLVGRTKVNAANTCPWETTAK